MSNKKRSRQNRHHVIPESRGGPSSLENLANINVGRHEDYHTLFANLTPVEIVHYLANYFWKGNYDFVREAYEGRSNDRLRYNYQKRV